MTPLSPPEPQERASHFENVSIVGVAETKVGVVPERSSLQLHAEAVRLALTDAGLGLSDVDGLVTANSRVHPYLYHADVVAEYLGIHPRHALNVSTGGSTTISAIEHAAAMIAAGVCRVVVVAMADNLATGLGRNESIASMASFGHPVFERPYGPSIPAFYALVAQRYMYEYGVESDCFALVAEIDRAHASMHPGAQFRERITAAEVGRSRLIADPLRLLDCAPVSDGGAAIVLMRDGSHETPRHGVRILGVGESHQHEHLTQTVDLTTTGAARSGAAAFRSAGLTPADIDVAMIYDAFSFLQCMQLEDLGFCAKGEGGEFVRSGHTRLGGSLPVNTNGGVLSFGHPGKPTALFLINEAVRQLRHECGERQVQGASVALVHAEGGILSSHATMILGGHDG